MLEALRGAGIRNYSIFRDGNQVFGYFEADDLERAATYLGGTGGLHPLAGHDGRVCSRSACPTPARRRSRRSSGSTEAPRVPAMPTVQLFATCLGDLVFPEAVADAEALLRQAGFEVEFPRAAGVLRPAGVQLRAPRGGPARRALVRARVLARGADRRPLGLVRDDGVALPAGAARRRAVRRVGAVRVPRLSTGSGRCRGTQGAGSPTTTRATCCASSRVRDAPRRLLERLGRGARPVRRGPISAAASAGRSPSASPRSRWRWPTRSWPAARRGTIVTADPGLPDAPARPRREEPARRFGSSTSRPRWRGASVT